MNIRLAYDSDFYYFHKLFPDIELFDWKKDKDLEIDLMIFPGGEDVSFKYYFNEPGAKENYIDKCYFNESRDTYEKRIFDYIMTDKLKVKKVLGVCRGIQFINVMLGGILFPDLVEYNIGHGSVHNIAHRVKSNLGFLDTVNSYHHQGLRTIGRYHKPSGKEVTHKVIATDKSGYVSEIVSWCDEKILGVQFHPEYYDEIEDKIKFRGFIYDWVNGETTIFPKEVANESNLRVRK